MSDWLMSATELVSQRRPDVLAASFVETIKRNLRLDECMLLVPNQDGRMLEPCGSEKSYSWSVSDFDAPFAHVLQSAQSMLLTSDELVFWRSNRAFGQLTSSVGMFGHVLIQPLPLGVSRVQSILLAIGDTSELENLFADPTFIKYVDVFSNQWSLLNEMVKEERAKIDLSESLTNYTRDTERQNKCNQLSRTLLGESNAMVALREQVVSAASSQLSVMIQGETGTGKELVAQAVHDFSTRANAPFIAINCAAIPDNLLESELFGYSKGAFSGADSDKQGLIAQADGGTLFLDEIGDMPLSLQAKLLRVLESKSFRPVGSKQEQSSDFRLVSATHVNLIEQVRTKAFRQDLYYRLYQYPLTLPTLKQRVEDIELLSQHFVQHYNVHHNTQIRGVHYKAIDCLNKHSFPGNVRELKHLIEFGCAQTQDNTQVEADCFTHRLHCAASIPSSVSPISHVSDVVQGGEVMATPVRDFSEINDLKQAVKDYEYQIIHARLSHYSGDRAKAAKSLGMPKRTLAYKCLKLEIEAS
ncbi:sigma-54 interaction domain-containing protein [Vibrio paucivorans]|uniref:Sigma 54-interacting transcriptional regulator n=1 Tax=Vibrio paucivorans TaxID=2829489 RepID=A0A9X3HRF1_9VIBR|nr:sigma 54-interacting transcriptional regulator [Vibrio paucivorans]MCW8333864.1 sigma 54-interacting transcriptional regulator [Vibrio paucivorans]